MLDDNPGEEHWVVLDLEGIGEIDTMAIDVLRELLPELEAAGVAVLAVARASEHTRVRLARAGMLHPVGAAARG